jgi:hypothetical protein
VRLDSHRAFAERLCCFGIDGCLGLRGEQALAVIKAAVFGSFVARLSDPFIFRCPTVAFGLLCIKTKLVPVS